MSIQNPFTPGEPVNIVEIAAHVAHERGLGAEGEEGFITLIRVAELTAIVSKTNQVVRTTDAGLVDVITGIRLDDIAESRRRFAARYPDLERLASDNAVVVLTRHLRAGGMDI